MSLNSSKQLLLKISFLSYTLFAFEVSSKENLVQESALQKNPMGQHQRQVLEADGDEIADIKYKDYGAGTLLMPEGSQDCKELKVFFPGHAQELKDSRGNKLKSVVPNSRRHDFIKALLVDSNYALKEPIVKSKCPVYILKDSSSSLSASNLDEITKDTGATKINIVSHSGGYEGLQESLNSWNSDQLKSVSSVAMLDNFYRSSVAGTLRNKFGDRIKSICKGFYTSHNASNYSENFSTVCPSSNVSRKSSHKAPVKDYF